MSIPGSATPLLLATTAAAAADFQIDRSLRFNSGDGAYLDRTPLAVGNRRTWTLSFWVKKHRNGGNPQQIFGQYRADTPEAQNRLQLYFDGSTDKLEIHTFSLTHLKTDRVFRDNSAWYHIVLAVDTTLATADNRMRLYVNGAEETSFTTRNNPSQDLELGVNTDGEINIGTAPNAKSSYYADVNLAEINFIDGQALAASDFGEYDSNNVWQPKEFTFTDSQINGEMYSLGSVSGTLYSGSSWANVFNGVLPSALSTTNSAMTYSSTGDVTLTFPSAISGTIRVWASGAAGSATGTDSKIVLSDSSEITCNVLSSAPQFFSFGSKTNITSITLKQAQYGVRLAGIEVDGSLLVDGGVNSFHLDFIDNSSDQALGNDAAVTQPTLNPRGGMDVITYTGNGSTQTIGGLAFEPDFVWLKSRNNNYDHELYDSVRGATKRIYANATDAEATFSNGLTSFDPSGFSVGSRTNVNGSSSNMVAWCWKAGGPAETNTDGSINSQVSVSTDYGFSIVTWTGQSSGSATIGHGLSSAPKFIILTGRTGSVGWTVGHESIGWTKRLKLNGTDAESASSNYWNDTAPTSSVFTSGANNVSNTFVAYCWSEISGFSKFGSYTGNGSSTGPTVTTGFKPRFLLIKNTNNTDGWSMWDTARDPSNPNTLKIEPNSSGAEGSNSVHEINFLDDGFQVLGTWAGHNGSGNTMIYMAFADRPGNNWTPNNLVAKAGIETANQGFDVVTYSGNGSTQSISSLAFQPDFVWIKCRNDSVGHQLFDQVRGAGKSLVSNATDAERTNHIYGYLSAFTSDGFTVTAGSSDDFEVNGSSETYVGWCWNAGANSNKTYTVKVVSDSGNKYRFDDFGTSAVTLDLQEGSTYIFDQSDSSNAGHPIRFGTSANGTDYTTGVTHTGTPGSAGAKTTLVLGTGVATLYYSCANHSGMGGQINTNSTAGASNFDGSIQSVAKATTTYGFSVVTYTGTGSNATVGHGLPSTPKWIVVKRRNSAGSWIVWYDAFGAASNTDYLYLNGQIAKGGDGSNAFWNSTVPTSSVFSVGTGGSVNASGATYVAYCWSQISGFSRFDSYIGNGSSTGPTITTGFKPRFLLIKADIAGEDWVMLDTARDSGNPVDQIFFANTNDSELTNSAYSVEFKADGFQIKNTNPRFNTSGSTYYYAAFASKPPGEVIDSLIDTPTNYTADSGNNGGNYPVLNPVDLSTSYQGTYANGNLEFTKTGSTWASAKASIGMTSGKWYCEVTTIDTGTNNIIGVHDETPIQDYLDRDASGYGWRSDGAKVNNNTVGTNIGSYSAGDIMGLAFDADAKALYFYKNNSLAGSFTGITPSDGTYFFAFTQREGKTITVNFGQRPFAYTPPTGYVSLCTQNLTDPTIADGSTVFDVRSGLTAQFTISDLNFAADLVVAKSTSNDEYWICADVVRSFIGGLRWNDTNAEGSGTAIASVGATGYQSDSNWFTTGRTYATFNWDAGTSTATNNDGSIASSVRVNQSAGFSIAQYTVGNNTSQTIGHGLNAAPSLIIVKETNQVNNWQVQHASLGNTKFLYMNSDAAAGTNNLWDNTSPTNSVFTIRSGGSANFYDGKTQVAYCFAPVAGYSAFGSYTGNGSTDGPFIFTGMRPAFVLWKRTDALDNWAIIDNSRSPFNVADDWLGPNSTSAESSNNSAYAIDMLSNGFKVRASHAATNASGGTYIYAAFAEHPFKTARAR